MRSVKILAIAATLAAMIAGPVVAQEATPDATAPATEMGAPSTDMAKPAPVKKGKHKAAKKHAAKKHHKKKAEDGVTVGK